MAQSSQPKRDDWLYIVFFLFHSFIGNSGEGAPFCCNLGDKPAFFTIWETKHHFIELIWVAVVGFRVVQIESFYWYGLGNCQLLGTWPLWYGINIKLSKNQLNAPISVLCHVFKNCVRLSDLKKLTRIFHLFKFIAALLRIVLMTIVSEKVWSQGWSCAPLLLKSTQFPLS